MTEVASDKVDTTNRHLVTAYKGHVVIQLIPRSVTPVQAVELAAWLVSMAEIAADDNPDAGTFDAEAYFAVALAAIRNT